jgi:predicted nucleic acid-binding protein
VNVLVDTSVWSLAMRRRSAASKEAVELSQLVKEGRVEIIGPIRQEILTGIQDQRQFEELRLKLSAFQDIRLKTRHFELAADFNNQCRKRGIQGSHTDFLICSVAHLERLSVYTTDQDFRHYAKHISLVFHHARHHGEKGPWHKD